ncbi:hypothetical protein LTR09_008920 [Extremus antarcticus]|uniref:Uncharacterized protein n=1 Tax=Extremus antarcticus TaxID=702011 RepID=A0AAJ0DGF2_9PEZI|nr:hypothetical protein LTR09_008920 [Extremus antarcticus]
MPSIIKTALLTLAAMATMAAASPLGTTKPLVVVVTTYVTVTAGAPVITPGPSPTNKYTYGSYDPACYTTTLYGGNEIIHRTVCGPSTTVCSLCRPCQAAYTICSTF